MANKYIWTVSSMQCYPTHKGKSNVVCSVGFSISATDGVNTLSVLNTLTLTYNENSNFIDYDGLTSETVLGWVQSALGSDGINNIQTELDVMLFNLANPPVITHSLPWAN